MGADRYFLVMKMATLAQFTVGGLPVGFEDDSIAGFLPAFKTRERAEAWAGGAEHVRMVEAITPAESRPEREGR